MAFSPQGLSKPNSRLSVCVKHEQVRVALCIRDTLKLIESHEDVPIGDTDAGRFQEFVDDIISTVKCGDVKVLQTSLPLFTLKICSFDIWEMQNINF